MGLTRRLSLGVMAVSVALVAGACGGDDNKSAEPAGSSGQARPGSDLEAAAGSTEVQGPQPRLVVTDARSGRLSIIDLESTKVIESLTLDGASKVTMVDNRYAFAVDGPGGQVNVIDAGSWTIDHGDHTHSYVAQPKSIGTLKGTKPAHVVPGDKKVAVFFDGLGSAQVLDVGGLGKGTLPQAATVKAEAPHHGVIAPVAGHFVVSRSVKTPGDSRPGTFELHGADGKKVQDFPTACPRMHGEAVFDDRMLGACDDGVFVVTNKGGQWGSEKIPYPAGITATSRPTTFREQHGVDILAATAGPAATNDGVLVLNSATKQWQHIRTPDRALNVNLSGDGKSVFAVLADGTFRAYDAATGQQQASAPVLAAPYNWSDKSATAPVIVVSGNRAYVSDPAAGVVKEVDYADNARVARTIKVDMAASSLGVAGL